VAAGIAGEPAGRDPHPVTAAGRPRAAGAVIAGAVLAATVPWVMAPPAAAADPHAAGRAAFQKCYACHSLVEGEGGLQGPNLRDVVGRQAAADPEFDAYSAAMRAAGAAGRRWTADALDVFLADPDSLVPGTDMARPGTDDPGERAALIRYLRAIGAGRTVPDP